MARRKQDKFPTRNQNKQPQRDSTPKVRYRTSVGIHAVRECIKARSNQIVRVLVREGWESSKDLEALVMEAKANKVKIQDVNSNQLDKIASHHQGIACEINGRPSISIDEIGKGQFSTVLALDGVEDPHNLGAIFRTAWLMGVQAILVPLERAVGLTPTVSKVSCGGVEHVPLIEVPNLPNLLKNLKEKGFWVFGLAAGTNKTLMDLNIPEKVIWVLGSEDKGLRTTVQKMCDELVSIPQSNDAASYNVSVAASITLYETKRQANKQIL